MAIWYLVLQSRTVALLRKIWESREPLHTCSYTSSLLSPWQQKPINLTRFMCWMSPIELTSALNCFSP
uniref:Uncharacterized protein n=1 Tax=Arundo donax TaxID=35708 RepID=A0A0A9AEU1_ARUDO